MSMEDALKVREMKDVNLDIDMKLPPYDYQKVGALFMYIVKKCFILDDPGLGKTIEGIAYIKLLQKYEKKLNVKVLVLTTSSTIYQWAEEIEKFSNLVPVVVDGSNATRTKIYQNFPKGRQNVLIMNYSKINYDFEKIQQLQFDTAILDEASALKDSTSKSYKLWNIILAKLQRLVLMTATPISNNLEEFYNLFQLFNNNYLPPYPEFREHFLETKDIVVKKGSRRFTIQSVIGSKNISEFRELIKPFFIRRENTNQGDFANFKLYIEKVPILMSLEQKQTIARVRRDHFSNIEESIVLKVFSDFTKVACCPCIYSPDLSNFSPKLLEMIKLVKHLDSKVVVFAKFIEFHAIMQDYLNLAGISFVSITGEQSPREKDESKKKFSEDPDVKVMLLTGAGKFGLNLQISNIIIFVDMPYTPSEVFQLIGRVYRTGQASDVTAYFLYHSNSLEEELFMSLYRKQAEIDEFFEQNKGSIFELQFDSDVDVKQSFIKRNYLEGENYDSCMSQRDWEMVPEKRVSGVVDNKIPLVEKETEKEFFTVHLI